MTGIVSRVGLVCLMLFATACTTVHRAEDPLKVKVDSTSGTVLLSLTLNTGEATQFQTIFLHREEDGSGNLLLTRQYQMTNVVPGISRDTALFVGVLPSGTYQFLSMFAQGKVLNIDDNQRALIGSFRIGPKQTVDLGRLLLSAVNFKVLLGRSYSIRDNHGLVDAVAKQYSGLYQAPVMKGWTLTDDKSAVVERFASLHPQGAGGFSELADGRVVGGTRLGTVIARNPDGRWRILARTGLLDAILSTAPYEKPGYVAVAGGELGTLVKVRQDGSVEPVPRGDLPMGNYIFIDAAPDYSRWFVGVQLRDKAVLYVADSLENGKWKSVREDTTQPSPWSGLRGVWFWRHGKGIGYASTSSEHVACFNYAQAHWNENSTPSQRGLISVAGGPGTEIGVLTQAGGGFGGVFAKAHYSHDCGSTWIETSSPYTVKVSPPILLPSGHILEGGGAFGDKGIYRSIDSGKTWKKATDEVVVFDNNLTVLPKSGMFSVSRGQFGFEVLKHSSDEGSTWTTELSSIDRELLNRASSAKTK